MPNDWEETTWGEAVELKYGKAIRGYQDADEAYPVFGTNGQVGTHTQYLAEGPGVILGRKGAYRGVHYSKQPFFVIDTAYYVAPKQELDMRWVYYAMQHYKLGQIDDGSPIPSTTRAAVYSSEFKRPPIGEQQDIAACLGTLDDKIELNRRMNETLEEMARAVFRDWFVDFGPTRRQIEGATDPAAIMGHAFPTEKAATLAPLFPAKLGDDGLPEGWEKRDLRSALTLNYGKSLTKKARNPGQFNVFGSGGISGTHDKALAKGPSVIVGRKGTVGSLYWTREDFYAIDTVFYVTSDFPMVYCHRLLETLGLETMNTDAAVPGLNRDNAYRQEFAFGGESLIDAYAEFVGTLTEKSDTNKQENQTLAEMRDLLLPKLMSGEIRLRDAEDLG